MQGHDLLKEKAFLLLHAYMDYIIPVAVLLTFPLWILPALIYYTNYKLFQIAKCILRMGNHIVGNLHPQEPAYAILKGNGRYLREDSENVHKKQFYDYTSRRFMTVGKFQPQTKIIELECQTQTGLLFFTQNIDLGVVAGLHSNESVIKTMNNSLGLITPTNYEIEGESIAYDVLMLFNLKNKMKANRSKTDLLTILAYCRHRMDQSSYLVYGDYFEPGQAQTFLSIFEGFRFVIADQEDITKNIQYATKLANKKRVSFEQQFMDTINSIMSAALGRQQSEERQFMVFILQKGE